MPDKNNTYRERQDNIRNLKITPCLESIENIYSDRDYTVELKTDELTTVCPKTGLPDFAKLSISYVPDRFLVEEKSLKLYLTGYRNIGIFQENATNKILDDFVDAVKPRRVRIIADWNNRGGISVHVECIWPKQP
jgi:7-cyano-7-deazaguanine reductase